MALIGIEGLRHEVQDADHGAEPAVRIALIGIEGLRLDTEDLRDVESGATVRVP